MMNLYLIALAVGGTLVMISLAFGGDGDDIDLDLDADVDVDMEMDADADLDADADADADAAGTDALDGWLPITSIRFWTFFLAFFGLTGTLIAGLGLAQSPIATGLIAGAVGWASGAAMIAVYRRLKTDVVDSHVSDRDCLGASATVVVPVLPGQLGKVRLEIKGRTVELLARSEDEALGRREHVVVYEVETDGRVLVARAPQLTS